MIHRLSTIREHELEIFKDFVMFEQRIFSHRLPKSFGEIKVEHDEQPCQHEENKSLQEFNRQMLNVKTNQYEIKIRHDEHLYQRDLSAFEFHLLQANNNRQTDEMNNVMTCVKTYLNHKTKTWICRIRYEESLLHSRLLRLCHRGSLKDETTHVYPQVIIDSSKISLSRIQLDYLSCNGKLKLHFH